MDKGWSKCYPRPLMRRDSFMALDGDWTLDGQKILVPFPPQAPASGFQGPVGQEMEYRAAFLLPRGFLPEGSRLILHFGAVDQSAQVFVNDRPAACHQGGYMPFRADITDLLVPGENRLRVAVEDTLSPDYPHGKQCENPHGMWYTPVSGIWQTVWLEAVPENGGIRSVRADAELDAVTFTVETTGQYTLEIPGAGIRITTGEKMLRVAIPSPRLWTPEEPNIYDYTVDSGTDRVSGYFALRTVEVRDGKILLNGKPVFLHGVLDQGYYPEGIFLPPGPEGYREDILRMKALGFNTLRKHVKVEPEAFYEACDRLGMLVIQDMVSAGEYRFLRDTLLPTLGFRRRRDTGVNVSARRRELFEGQLRETVERLRGHPSVIAYVLFNEGWGQYESDRLYAQCKALDPTRMVISASGWFAQKLSDAESRHIYFRSCVLKRPKNGRALMLTECGGFSRRVTGHVAEDRKNYGYGKRRDTEEALTRQITELYEKMVLPSIPNGLCCCVYTQLSDVEGETNGLYTYDRAVLKVDPQSMQSIAQRITQTFENNL